MSLDPSTGTNRGQVLALCFSYALIGAVLWPIGQNWRAHPKDNFPLSYYPMFSAKREAVETFYYVVGLDAEGKRRYIPHTIIGDGGGNQVRRQLRKIVNAGRAPELAQQVAERLARKRSYRKIVSVSVIRGQYSVDDFFHGKKDPISERVYGFAEVERKAAS
jgi:hypothetical protein